jgi:lysozyme
MKVCDVSKWNGDVDFDQLRAEGFDGVFIRAGDGLVEDPRFQAFRNRARAAGLYVGFYWFFRPNLDWRAQAQKFLAVVGGDRGDFGLVIDLEVTGGTLPVSRILVMAQLFCQYVGAKIIYTSPGFWNSLGGALAAWAAAYDLWIAQWPHDASPNVEQIIPQFTETVLSGGAHPVSLRPWPAAEWWQFTAKGKAAGNRSAYIDLDASIRSIEGVKEHYGLSGEPGYHPPVSYDELVARFSALEKWLMVEHGYIIEE